MYVTIHFGRLYYASLCLISDVVVTVCTQYVLITRVLYAVACRKQAVVLYLDHVKSCKLVAEYAQLRRLYNAMKTPF